MKQKAKPSPSKSGINTLHVTTPNQEPSTSKSGKSENPNKLDERKCKLCTEKHALFVCPTFKKFSARSRRGFVTTNQICMICLQPSHPQKMCSSRFTCKKCSDKHHFLLHDEPDGESAVTGSIPELPKSNTLVSSSSNIQGNKPVLKLMKGILPTAIIHVKDRYGNDQPVRILLDTASDMSLISEECMQHLNLPRQNARIQVSGVSESEAGVTRGNASLKLSSRFNPDSVFELSALKDRNIA